MPKGEMTPGRWLSCLPKPGSSLSIGGVNAGKPHQWLLRDVIADQTDMSKTKASAACVRGKVEVNGTVEYDPFRLVGEQDQVVLLDGYQD
jgi:hypothetical protein